jgi:hypothetical protein
MRQRGSALRHMEKRAQIHAGQASAQKEGACCTCGARGFVRLNGNLLLP